MRSLVVLVASTALACTPALRDSDAGDASAAIDGAGATADAAADAGPPGVLFVMDIGHSVIETFPTLDPPPGTATPGRLISLPSAGGTATAFGPDLSYDAARDELYATSGGSVVVFDHASTASGTVTPARTITPPPAAIVRNGAVVMEPFKWPLMMFRDAPRDRLYVAGTFSNCETVTLVFHNASALTEGAQPAGSLFVDNSCWRAFTIDTARSRIYVAGRVGSQSGESVTAGLSSLGLTTIHFLGESFSGLAVDPDRDRLYAAVPVDDSLIGRASVVLFDAASVVTNFATAGRVAIASPRSVTVDAARDRLYVGANDKAYVLSAASALGDGALPASATVVLTPADSAIAGVAFP